MCKTNNQIKLQLAAFVDVIYPELTRVLDQAAICDTTALGSVNGQQVPKEMVTSIKLAFQSLVTYEKKLVFPAIEQLFDPTSRVQHTPNLTDLLQLTKSKEHKIHSLVRTLATILQTEALLTHSSCYDQLVDQFDQHFFEAKEKWNSMLMHKISNCACFRKAQLVTINTETPNNNGK